MKQTGFKDGKRAVLGASVTLAVYLGLLALSALLLEQGRVGESHVTVCVTVCAFLAAFAGAKAAAWGMAKSFVPVTECVGAAFCIIVLTGFLTNDALDVRRVLELAASMAAGGVCAALLRVGKRGKKHARRARR